MTRSLRGDIVTPTNIIRDGWIAVDDDGKIAEINTAGVRGTADVDVPGCLIMAGFIDMHVHGGGGADFMDGEVDAVRTVCRTHARHGTTSLLATTLTAAGVDIDRAITSAIEVSLNRHEDGARIVGIHLEGPYICPAKRGAQPLAPIRKADIDELHHWIDLSGGKIRQITMAPEMDGALDFITQAAARGIVVSIGHTEATAAQTRAGIDAGARQATHLFNAMRGLHHREPGTVGAMLTDDRAVCELIVDGVHLHPSIVKIAVAARGADGCLLITDAIEGADMPDGTYSLGATTVIVKNGTAMFEDGTLAGSVLTMERAYCNLRAFTDLTHGEASKMASLTPGRQIGIADRTGSLEVGKDADIVVLDPRKNEVEWTIIAGKVAYRR